jgi:hypothetical protein
MLDEYQRLVDANKRLEECKEVANSRDSVAELQEWLNEEAPKSVCGDGNLFTTITTFSQDDLTRFLLPEAGMSTKNIDNELNGHQIGDIDSVSICSSRRYRKYQIGTTKIYL